MRVAKQKFNSAAIFNQIRLEFLKNNAPDCPLCKGSEASLKIKSISVPARWCCMSCMYEWNEEPPKYSYQLHIPIINTPVRTPEIIELT